MSKKKLLVKRRGHMEAFDEKKVYASVYAAGLNAHLREQEAEQLAKETLDQVRQNVDKQAVISSIDIRQLIVRALGGEESDVAFLYLNHLDIN